MNFAFQLNPLEPQTSKPKANHSSPPENKPKNRQAGYPGLGEDQIPRAEEARAGQEGPKAREDRKFVLFSSGDLIPTQTRAKRFLGLRHVSDDYLTLSRILVTLFLGLGVALRWPRRTYRQWHLEESNGSMTQRDLVSSKEKMEERFSCTTRPYAPKGTRP